MRQGGTDSSTLTLTLLSTDNKTEFGRDERPASPSAVSAAMRGVASVAREGRGPILGTLSREHHQAQHSRQQSRATQHLTDTLLSCSATVTQPPSRHGHTELCCVHREILSQGLRDWGYQHDHWPEESYVPSAHDTQGWVLARPHSNHNPNW